MNLDSIPTLDPAAVLAEEFEAANASIFSRVPHDEAAAGVLEFYKRIGKIPDDAVMMALTIRPPHLFLFFKLDEDGEWIET